MKPTSTHPELKTWNLPRDAAARSKCSFLLDDTVPSGTPLNGLDIDSRGLVFELINSLRAIFHPTLESHGCAVRGRPRTSPVPMHVFESWEDYKTSAKQAYYNFLRPVYEAIETLKVTHGAVAYTTCALRDPESQRYNFGTSSRFHQSQDI